MPGPTETAAELRWDAYRGERGDPEAHARTAYIKAVEEVEGGSAGGHEPIEIVVLAALEDAGLTTALAQDAINWIASART